MNDKILLFGGSFDPPHLGHLLVAQWVADMFGQKVRFLPSGNPPHKRPLTAAKHRLAMLNLALDGNPDFILDQEECGAGGINYTADTLAGYGQNRDNLCFILGSDALNSLESWHRPQDIIALCTLIVYEREPVDTCVLKRLKDMGANLIFCQAPILALSSSLIRDRISQGKSIRYMVADTVRAYIQKTGLYQAGKVSTDVESSRTRGD